MLSYFYSLSMFIYRWSSNFVEKVGWATENSSRASWLVYYIAWEGEFEQNIAKIRLSIKDNT